jgi:gas vesicle protein
MFSKLVALSCLAAVALARNDRDALELKDALAETANKAANVDAKITAGEHGTRMISESVGAADDSVTGRLSTVTDAIETINSDAADLADNVASQLDETKDYLDKALIDTTDTVSDRMKDAIRELTAKIAEQKASIDKKIADKLKARVAEADAIDAQVTASKARLAKRQVCAAKGELYNANKDECLAVVVSDGASMARVSHSSWNNDVGGQTSYLNSRNLVFNKYYDDTYMRILYYDNIRVHGHTAHGKWNVLICDANGNGCSHCADPGRLQNWRYSSHQGNWWMNDHVGGTIFGLCKKAENRDLKKGQYMIRTYLDSTRYWMSTGWNQYGSFTVDEVMKY